MTTVLANKDGVGFFQKWPLVFGLWSLGTFEGRRPKSKGLLEQLFDILSRTTKHRPASAFYDRPLHQIRMLDHKCYQLRICVFLRCDSQFAINRLALSEEITRTDLHLAY